ncbi:MAG: hypothetical protein M0T84_16960 [Betaproteobacteria bacterium]|nr:hypothetical protein [Betaproteobacteria bacterium]
MTANRCHFTPWKRFLEGLVLPTKTFAPGRSVRRWHWKEGGQGRVAALAAKLPDSVLDRMSPIVPTLIYRLAHRS